MRWTALVLASVTVGLVILLALMFARNVYQQLGGDPSRIQHIAESIANGDLDMDLDTGNRSVGVYASMVRMRDNLSLAIEEDIQSIVNAAQKGDLNKRVELRNKQGFYKKLGAGVNDLVEVSQTVVDDLIRIHGALAKGDLSEKITNEYQGSFDLLKQDANATIDKVKSVIEGDIQELVDAASNGDLSKRIDTSDKQGFFLEMSLGINSLVDSVNRIFDDASVAMTQLSKGNLNQPVTNEYVGQFDELKSNINETMLQLKKTITRLRESSNIVSSASVEIAEGNNDLSSRTEQQASALEQTAASMEQLTSTVKNNAENSAQADQLAVTARSTAEKGGQIMQQASSAMEEINHSSEKIARIIGVINEIAFQTNLLALNASVEAARAGEQGRGFAVVATEVRNLASRSAIAAKEIKELIGDSVKKVGTGVDLVNRSTGYQSEIIESITRVGSIITEISMASKEQADGIEQVNSAVTSMDNVTQQNAALAEETSAAATSLCEHAAEMNNMMDFFTVSNNTETSDKKISENPLRAMTG